MWDAFYNVSDKNEIPKDFAKALKEGGLDEFFASYPPSHQREHLKWITEAKRPETRKKRIEQSVKMISDKRAKKAARG
jgi:uncharacterized protein YdeI (YjbR/CyaY-like superfamily)